MIDRTDSIMTGDAASVGLESVSELELVRHHLAEAEAARDRLQRRLEQCNQELERTQARLQALTDHAPSYIHMVDSDLRVTFINRGGTQVKVSHIVGTRVGEYMPPADRYRVRRRLRRVLATGKPTEYEFAGLGEHNQQGWYRTHAGPVKRGGRVVGLVLITFDITKDRYRTLSLQAEKQTAESAWVRNQALFNSIGEGLIVIDERGLVANANPAAAAMLGYSADEMSGQWFPRVVQATDATGQKLDAFDRPAIRALLKGGVVTEQIYYRRKDGSMFPAAVTVSPVVMADKPIGAIEVLRDLTREHELERTKEEFVSLASHQLRTPATGVKAYISMLLDGYAGKLSHRQQQFLQKVYDTNERQLQIVGDMLSVARMDAGRMVPDLAETDLTALITAIVDEQRPTLGRRRQQLEIKVPSAPLAALVDPKLIHMAVENIVSNASKYTPERGTVAVELGATAQHAVLTVSDNGVGIADVDLPKLFQRFSRIDNPLSARRGGSGLGLYLAQAIVLLHQGRIRVHSRVGVGTTFTIELPRGHRVSEPSSVGAQPSLEADHG